MFFSISQKTDNRFPNNFRIDEDVWFNCDNGWDQNDKCFAKGYQDSAGHGNFTKVEFDQTIGLIHDITRSYPLYWDDKLKILTNLGNIKFTNCELLHNDRCVEIEDWQLKSNYTLPYNVPTTEISLQTAITEIRKILISKTSFLKDSDITPKLFFTGGVDTGLLMALLNHENIQYDLVDYEFFAYDEFTRKNIGYIRKNYWGYTQIHHWKEPSILISGAPGDEYLFRGPAAISLYSKFYDIDIINQLHTNHYHHDYFLKDKNMQIFRNPSKTFDSEYSLKKYLLDVNVNDFQHWHIGNTLTWTPFKDIRISEIMLQLNATDLLGQFLNAEITFELIKSFDASLIKFISPQKNSTYSTTYTY